MSLQFPDCFVSLAMTQWGRKAAAVIASRVAAWQSKEKPHPVIASLLFYYPFLYMQIFYQ
jgi:hypothetical protein